MAPSLIRGLAVATAGFLALAGVACAPPPSRPAVPAGKAHGIAVEGKLTTEAGVRQETGLSRTGPGTPG